MWILVVSQVRKTRAGDPMIPSDAPSAFPAVTCCKSALGEVYLRRSDRMTKIQAFAFPFVSRLTLEKSLSRLSKAKPQGAPCVLGHHQRMSAELFSHLSCSLVSAGDQLPHREESCSEQGVGPLDAAE